MEKNDKQAQLTEEELKAIGEIEIGPAKHEVFLNNHYKKLLVGILVASVGAGLAIAHFSNKNDERAQAASMIVEGLQGEGGYNAAPMPAIAGQFAHSPSAPTAQLITALAALEAGKVDEALAQLQTIANAGGDITISSRAAAAAANYYMGEGINDKATTLWQQVANMPQNPYSGLAYMNLGDIAKLGGDKEAARSYYEAAKTKCETSALINGKDVEMRLLLLDVDAPKPVLTSATPDTSSEIEVPQLDTEIKLDADLDTLPPLSPTE